MQQIRIRGGNPLVGSIAIGGAKNAALMTALAPGELKIVHDKGEQFLFVGTGFLEVLPDRVTILADVGERAEDIDEERAEAARKRARERLALQLTPAENLEAELALAAAEARLRLARARRG